MRMLTAKSLRFEWLLVVALSCALNGYAQQDEKPAQEETAEVPETTSSGQVEANEDIYRQFMELKDGLQRTDTAPQESWQSRARLQKLEELPEDSQKHLRNQLREIIVAGEAWQPGDEHREYPYVPSAAARNDRRLQNQEAGAWAELLDNYHAREAQIHANATRSDAASAGPGSQDGTMSAGMEMQEQEFGAGQQGQDSVTPASEAEDSFAPSVQAGASAADQQGVAQSAMEFLQQSGYRSGRGQAEQPGQPERQGQLVQQPGQEGQSGQAADAQRSQAAEQGSTQNQGAAAAAGMPLPAQASAGAEQSAMQYLQQAGNEESQGSGQANAEESQGAQSRAESQPEPEAATDPSALQQSTNTADEEPSSEGVAQSALEYLSRQAPAGESADTLSVQDLLDASGIGAGTAAGGTGANEPPGEPDREKDGSGG